MKFEIIFDHMPEYVLIHTEGTASNSGFDDLLTSMVNSPKWVIGTSQIVDHRKLIIDHITSYDMTAFKDIVKNHSKKLGKGPCAFIINNSLGFGIARMYELLGGDNIHLEIKVFHSINEATKWIKQLKQCKSETSLS